MAEEKIVLAPYEYIARQSGKKTRNMLIQALNYWLNAPTEHCKIVDTIVDIMNTASLILDDVEDDSWLRRGVPAAHTVYGTSAALNSANYVVFMVLEKFLTEFHDSKCIAALRIFSRNMLELQLGQGIELHWRENLIIPEEEDYLKVARQKTGNLFSLALELLQLESDHQRDYRPLVSHLGAFYQLHNDYINLKSEKVFKMVHPRNLKLFQIQYIETKSFAEDISEGKISFPVIHSLKQRPEDLTLLCILRQRPKDYERKKLAVDIMESTGSLEYTKETCVKLLNSIKSECLKLGSNPFMSQLCDHLAKDLA